MLDVEGLWTRYEDPAKLLEELADARRGGAGDPAAAGGLRRAGPPELIAERVKEHPRRGVTVAVRVSPQHTLALAPVILAAGVDLLVIQGTIVSAEHVSTWTSR